MPEAECERHGPVCAEPEDASIARIDECTHHTDCVIVPASCCPACGMPEIDDVRAIARGHEHEYESEVCTERSTECGSCETENNAWLVPRCSDGVCGVIDLRETEIVRCSTDGDCRLRAVTCCECAIGGDASRVVAISRDADEAVAELLCHEGQTCRSCVPGYPMDVIAHCDEGRCGTRAR